MAADKDDQQSGNAGGIGGNKKLILLIVGVVVLAIGVSVGVTWFLLSGSSKPDAEAATAGEVAEGTPKALYLDLPPAFVVTYDYKNRQRYMQVFVTALTRDAKAVDAMKLHLPLLRHQLNVLFGEQGFDVLQTDEGKQALRKQSAEVINKILEKESPGVSIEQVLFTNFVMQ